MGSRRRSRELALQALFYVDMGRTEPVDARLALFCQNRVIPASLRPFFDELVGGVLRHAAQLDRMIEERSRHWRLARMSAVDRNVMRIAVYEICTQAAPPKVAINEAIEIGRKYGSDESAAFINGILDSIHQALQAGDVRFEPVAAPQPVAAPPPTPPAAPPKRPRVVRPAIARVRGGKPGVVKRQRRASESE
jgi:N utilization substance protein B